MVSLLCFPKSEGAAPSDALSSPPSSVPSTDLPSLAPTHHVLEKAPSPVPGAWPALPLMSALRAWLEVADPRGASQDHVPQRVGSP